VMSESSFQKVIALLSSLSRAELATVIYHAQQLSASSPARGSKQGKPRQAKPADGKSKGPAQPVSKFLSHPEYVAFKAAEKDLSALLKERKSTLKVLQAEVPEHPVLVKFLGARNEWFQAKTAQALSAPAPQAGLHPDPGASSSSSSTSSSSSSSTPTGSSGSGAAGAHQSSPPTSARPKKEEERKKGSK